MTKKVSANCPALKDRKPNTIVEFFDPYKIDHIKAFRHLQKTGFWPLGFVPETLEEAPSLWYTLVADKMVNAWLIAAESGEVAMIPK